MTPGAPLRSAATSRVKWQNSRVISSLLSKFYDANSSSFPNNKVTNTDDPNNTSGRGARSVPSGMRGSVRQFLKVFEPTAQNHNSGAIYITAVFQKKTCDHVFDDKLN